MSIIGKRAIVRLLLTAIAIVSLNIFCVMLFELTRIQNEIHLLQYQTNESNFLIECLKLEVDYKVCKHFVEWEY